MEEKRKFNSKGGKSFAKKDNKGFAKKDSRKFDGKKDKGFAGKKDNFKKLNDSRNSNKYKDKKVEEKVEKVEEVAASNVRYYIYKCLYNIYVNKAFSNIEIDHVIRENNINELDAKLLTNVVYGTLSHDKVLNWEKDETSE